MKICYQCGHMTAGEPLFCNHCGRTYDVKLCPRLHSNPRSAEVCSKCGTRDLSMPQPRVSLWWKFFEGLVKFLFIVFVICIALAVLAGILQGALQRPGVQCALLALGFLAIALWWMWLRLPDWFRKAIYSSLKRKRRDHGRDN
jgi:hypothetical protein